MNSFHVKRGRKGQFTIIIILGIVLFFVFLMMFWVRSSIIKAKTTLQASNQLKEYISENSIDLYVTTCLDTITNEAIIRSSLQGGVFNFSGMQYDKDYITYHNTVYDRSFNISIAIKPNLGCDLVRNYPPDYPYPNTTVGGQGLKLFYNDGSNNATCLYQDIYLPFSGFFGLNNLTKLCSMTGPNKPISTSTLGIRTCERGTYNDFVARDIQDEMQQYIIQEIKKCVNFQNIMNRSASNITVLNDTPMAEVVFATDGFTVRLNYSFAISMNNEQPVVKMAEFAVKKNTPLKELYDYAFYAIINDVSEADYNIINDRMRPDIAQYYRGYTIMKIKDIDNNYTDVVQIIDNDTVVNGKPLMFEFAIQNRRPALEQIGAITPFYDYIGIENETLEIDPKGLDPDEDHIFYNFSLWKEDYDDRFNFSNILCSNGSSLQYVIANCTIHNMTSHPHNWTNSTLFNLTHQNASFVTRRLDTGYHLVNVSVWDRQLLNDYQTVRILILDRPVARITGSNFYADVNDSYASYEDPYLFNGSNSTVGISKGLFGGNFSAFVWNDTSGHEFYNISHIQTDADKLFLVPNNTNGSYTIMNLTPYVFSNNTKNKSTIRNITLIVNTTKGLVSFPAILTINVTQCLNHSNTTNPPFPYNTDPNSLQNDLFADHACCLDTMRYAPYNASCYVNSSVGANMTFKSYNFGLLPPVPYTLNYIPLGAIPGLIDNDIFNRTFIRGCSGDRGNVCTGPGTEIRRVVAACNDNNFNPSVPVPDPLVRRCQGPPIDPVTGKFITSGSNNLTCQNYTFGNTFERYVRIMQGSTLSVGEYCDLHQRCSTPGAAGYSVPGGHFYCQGECSTTPDGRCNYGNNCTCNNANCGASLQCNNDLAGNHALNTCTGSGQAYFQDSCNDCMISDIAGTCVSGNAIAGCTASINCNGRHPLDPAAGGSDKYCTNACQVASCVQYNYNAGTHTCYNSCTAATAITRCAAGHSCVGAACI